jgi:TrmH family RNA methyltransferase
VEGHKLLTEALAGGATVQTVYLDPSRAGDAERAAAARAEAATSAQVIEVQAGVLDRACDTVTPQPVAAIVSAVDVPLDRLSLRRPASTGAVSLPGPLLICVGLQDPGNAGTILRIAAGSGAAGVVLCAGSVDLYNPKTVRASAGALFHVPITAGPVAEESLDHATQAGLHRWGTTARGGQEYTRQDLTAPTALIFGNEAHGLPAGLDDRLDGLLTIPLDGPAESLNVASATAVLCFEAARQRRARRPGR